MEDITKNNEVHTCLGSITAQGKEYGKTSEQDCPACRQQAELQQRIANPSKAITNTVRALLAAKRKRRQ